VGLYPVRIRRLRSDEEALGARAATACNVHICSLLVSVRALLPVDGSLPGADSPPPTLCGSTARPAAT